MTNSAGPSGYWTQAFYTTLNWLLYTLTFGRYLWLEGRRKRGRWHNWTHADAGGSSFLRPATQDEIVAAVRNHPQLRAVGAGHSFNTGVFGETLLSLDRYAGVLEIDEKSRRVRVRGGTRVRDVSRELHARGLAIVALPSHDAQSVAGILSTDVHGTGREFGFVSQSVVGLRIVDGRGEVHDVGRDDELFAAAIGGIGGIGLIIEATLQCVPAFHVRQRTKRMSRKAAETDLERLLAEHDHASFYVFPFADDVQLHTWDRTEKRKSFLNGFREYVSISWAALGAACLGDLLAKLGWLKRWIGVMLWTQKNSDLVMQSHKGFNRSIYHLHQELEFTVPIERTWEVTDHLVALYERMYGRRRMPFTLIELRFTPANGTVGLVSPGAGDQRHVYLNLCCNQSGAFTDYYAAAEEYMRTVDARPHVGKWARSITAADMQRAHGGRFERFRELRRQHDPKGKLENDFIRRVFGPVDERADPIFEPLQLRNLTVKNRVFRSSVSGRFDNYDGTGTYARLNWEEQFARGGVGAIISSFVPVTAEGAHVPHFATIEHDDRIPFWREVGARVHAHDGCKFILQLHHCGRQRDLSSVRNNRPRAPSSTNASDPLNGFKARALTAVEISGIVDAFAQGARRAKEAGLDGVEIHGANGYLLTQFLSKAINDRTDAYGGSVENRARILMEILKAIRGEVGRDFHVQVKINAEDKNSAVFPWLAKGNELSDAIAVAKLAVGAGADAIHVSSGSSFPHPDNPPGPLPLKLLKSTYDVLISEGGSRTFMNYLLLRYRIGRWIYGKLWRRQQNPVFEGGLVPLAAALKKELTVPVIVTGGFQRASLIRKALSEGAADAVSIARPLVANPDLVQHFAAGREVPPQPCSLCNRCLANMIEHPMGCYDVERFDGDEEAMIERVMEVFKNPGRHGGLRPQRDQTG